MVGNPPAGADETTLAGRRPLSLRQSEGRRHDFADRRHCRRTADGWRSRDRRAAAGRFLLRPDHPDLGRVAGSGSPCIWFDRLGGSDGARRRAANGDAAVNSHRRRLGFILATAGTLLALALPLTSETTLAWPARPVLLAFAVAAALSFAVAAWTRGSAVVLPGIAGVLCGAVTTLALLRDPAIAGVAAAGFWMMVLAVWLGAALCVMQLATMGLRAPGARRALDLAIPLLFGAVVFYLWEVLVRGFGVSPVIMPAPSKAAARFAAS